MPMKTNKERILEIGYAQRGNPEAAMLRVQFAMGGGVLNPVVEHVGDLIHRMSEAPTWETAGYGYVRDKINTALWYLEQSYGFTREFNENIENNAKARKLPADDVRKEVESALAKYAEEHRKLKPLNSAQYLANQAAIAVGEMKFHDASFFLKTLRQIIEAGPEWWAFRAHQVWS